MQLRKELTIDGIKVAFACSAGTPRRYRILTGGNLFDEMQKLDKNNVNTELIENLAYTMAKEADPEMQLSIDEWLDQFGPMSIIQVAPQLIALWTSNMKSESTSKKK